MNVTLFDYGAGNLHSLGKALERVGASVRVETDPLRALDTQALVLPGVGAFGAAALRLADGRELMRAALERGLPCLGVCLGMQLLFDGSDEGEGEGLGLIGGRVRSLRTQRRPHMGWNDVVPGESARPDGPHETAVPPELLAYFAHGYVCEPLEPSCVRSWCTLEDDRFPAIVSTARTLGVQFHPEKSGPAGLELLAAWLAAAARPEVRSCS